LHENRNKLSTTMAYMSDSDATSVTYYLQNSMCISTKHHNNDVRLLQLI